MPSLLAEEASFTLCASPDSVDGSMWMIAVTDLDGGRYFAAGW
jgi:hypothetical protein